MPYIPCKYIKYTKYHLYLQSLEIMIKFIIEKGLSWPWSYSSWIYNYLCNQCLLPLMLWVRISIRARYTTLC